jgi:hypothetical protein
MGQLDSHHFPLRGRLALRPAHIRSSRRLKPQTKAITTWLWQIATVSQHGRSHLCLRCIPTTTMAAQARNRRSDLACNANAMMVRPLGSEMSEEATRKVIGREKRDEPPAIMLQRCLGDSFFWRAVIEGVLCMCLYSRICIRGLAVLRPLNEKECWLKKLQPRSSEWSID